MRQRRDQIEVTPAVPSLHEYALHRLSFRCPADYFSWIYVLCITSSGVFCSPGEASPVFQDPVYSRSKHWRMSTSHLTHEMFDGWGWGEVVPDGEHSTFSKFVSLVSCTSNHFGLSCVWRGMIPTMYISIPWADLLCKRDETTK